VQETAIAAGEADGMMPVVLSGWDVAGWVELGMVGATGGLVIVERELLGCDAVQLSPCWHLDWQWSLILWACSAFSVCGLLPRLSLLLSLLHYFLHQRLSS
jgi:hypothetical protein